MHPCGKRIPPPLRRQPHPQEQVDCPEAVEHEIGLKLAAVAPVLIFAGVALAFGSAVTRLRGVGDAVVLVGANEQEIRSVKLQRRLNAQNVRKVMLVRVCEVDSDQVGDVRARVLAQDGEEVLRCGNLTIHLRRIIS